MADYQLTADATVIRTSDNAQIPDDPENRDRQAYIGWAAIPGNVAVPYVAQPPAPACITSQDLMAQFTAFDAVAIRTAVANDTTGQLFLLWSSLQAQSDPMVVTSARFAAGWNALTTVLGQSRTDAIAAALAITVN